MGGISAFRSDDARAAYCELYDAALAASPVPVTESDVETSFGRTHVLTAGDPSLPPLVALHASQVGSTSWLPLLPTLAANHHVLMVDVIGQVSKSIATKPITRTGHLVSWLDDTLGALHIERAAMVGMSMGSWIAAQYAVAFPARADRVALMCPVGLVSEMKLGSMLRIYASAARPSEARIEAFFDSFVTPASRATLREDPWRLIVRQFVVGLMGFRFDLTRAVRPTRSDIRPLSSARIPVLAIIGRQESLHDGPKMAMRLRRRLPEARVELIDDAGHLPYIDQLETIDKLLADFLR